MWLPGSHSSSGHRLQECGAAGEGNLEKGRGVNLGTPWPQGSVLLARAGGGSTAQHGCGLQPIPKTGPRLSVEGKGLPGPWEPLLRTTQLCVSKCFPKPTSLNP